MIKDFLTKHNDDVFYYSFLIHCFDCPSVPKRKGMHWTRFMQWNEDDIYNLCDGMIGFPIRNTNTSTNETTAATTNNTTISGMDYAVAFHRPIVLPEAATENKNQFYFFSLEEKNYNNNTKSFINALESMIVQSIRPNFFTQQDCKVAIDNHDVNYHYFLLESFMALYPLLPPDNTNNRCDHTHLRFTFLLNKSANPFARNRATSWKQYALGPMREKYQMIYNNNNSSQQQQQFRFVEHVEMNDRYNDLSSSFDYILRASCYCTVEDKEWLQNNTQRHYCVFHEACEEYNNSSQAVWLSPYYDRFILPTILPQFHEMDNETVSKLMPINGTSLAATNNTPYNNTIHYCSLGHPHRRNYDFVAHYLKKYEENDNTTFSVHFYNLGWGPIPEIMANYTHYLTRNGESNFIAFQHTLYYLCDVIVGLMSTDTTPYYFAFDDDNNENKSSSSEHKKRKQSGTILQAIAYQKPFVLHEALTEPYRRYFDRPDLIETHDDSLVSFTNAMDRMADKIIRMKG